MTNQSPITPPIGLVARWVGDYSTEEGHPGMAEYIANRTAQWFRDQVKADIKRQLQEAADQELEACCEWMSAQGYHCGSERMRNDRRPKQSSLKKQAIALINSCTDPHGNYLDDNTLTIIRRALEQLPDEQ